MRRLLLVLCISGCGGDWSGTDLLFASALPRRAALHAPDGGEAWNASVDGLTAMSEQARAIQDELDLQRRGLENRVMLLSPSSLDADMLDERARFLLGYTRPDEYVIISR